MSAADHQVPSLLLTLTVVFALGWLWLVWAVFRERRARRKVLDDIASGPALSITASWCCPHCGASLRQSGGSGSDSQGGNYATEDELKALK